MGCKDQVEKNIAVQEAVDASGKFRESFFHFCSASAQPQLRYSVLTDIANSTVCLSVCRTLVLY